MPGCLPLLNGHFDVVAPANGECGLLSKTALLAIACLLVTPHYFLNRPCGLGACLIALARRHVNNPIFTGEKHRVATPRSEKTWCCLFFFFFFPLSLVVPCFFWGLRWHPLPSPTGRGERKGFTSVPKGSLSPSPKVSRVHS